MNSKMRKVLFYFFVFMFFVLSGIILPYAFGYKFNLSGMKIQRTGIFDIKTTPSGASIYLNGKKQIGFLAKLSGQEKAATTPTKLKNIAPGTYQVKLELAGYWPWEKQLVVKPSETTYLEDVYFFKKSQPVLLDKIDNKDVQDVLLSPNKKYLAILTKTELKVFPVEKTAEPITINLPKNTTGALSWSNNNDLIAVGDVIIDWQKQTLKNLKNTGLKASSKLAWVDNNLIFFQEKKDIKILNLKTGELTITDYKKDVVDFTIDNSHLYLIRDGSEPKLSIIKINDKQLKELEVVKLKNYEHYHFVEMGPDRVNLQEASSGKLYSLNTKLIWLKDYTIQDIGPFSVGEWVNDGKLIFANKFELSLWTKDESQAKLLTRISNQINALAWHKSDNYVVFATNKTINTLELDDRYSYNISNLLDLQNIDHPVFNPDGDRVFFFSTINGEEGLYLLEI